MDVIIFDLDGTLLNTLDDLYICINYAIKQFGYPSRTIEEIRSFVGNGIRTAIKKALPENVTEEVLNRVVEVFKKYYIEHMNENTKPYDGILDMLKTLKDLGYKIAVLSNKYDTAVKVLCDTYFNGLIDIAAGEGFGIRKKPEIDGINKILEELNADKTDNIIYAGDSEVDIQTAKNAELPCISVLWGFKDKEFLEANGARIFAETPFELIKIIEKKLYLE